ncbi:hypothetical protein COW53_06410 [bacterium CG17_big_fil_post_rev_8_21_14_2_50_64_8]|nr:MAG: hypothetical protein COW53_06410 [bacterium CG17_big_fil_post_rev_8_21_14_2_50_64_8]PJA75001.1 MAG: hypothetical protein CO151_07710 [bacterium CG_4_9_14_3_um_filter_65_15]
MNRPSGPTGFLLVTLVLLWIVPSSGRPAVAAPQPTGESDASMGTVGSDAPVPSTDPNSLSFGDAVLLLEKNSRHLMAAADRENARRQERGAARGLRLPTVQLKARATRIDESIVIDLDPIRSAMLALHPTVPSAAIPPFESQIQDDQFFKAGVEMTWPIFTGGAITAANRAADARLSDAQEQTRSVEQSLHATLVERYFGVCLAEQARNIRRQVQTGMEQHLYQAVRLEAEGMISRAERLHAEVSQAEAARELQAAEQDVLLAKAALRALLHEQLDPRPSSKLFVVHDLPSLEVMQHDAVGANPNLLRLEAQQKLAESAVSVERADYLPDVALFARYELYPDDLTELDPRWAAGIGLQLNIFDGFARGHRVSAARATASMVDHARQGAQNDIALLVEHNYRRVVKAVEQFDTLEATIELATENLRVRTRAFEEGMATSLDVVDAVNMLSGVELAQLGAAHDFVTSLAELLAATGHAESFADYMQKADVEVTS